MKKYLFLLMALFAFSSVNAQVKIGGSMSNHIISFHVEDANKGKLNMTMIFQDNYNSLPANPVLLIKLMDNTVIELKGKRTRNEIITNPDLHQRTHNDAATFTLTKDQFNKMSKGVKKLRINCEPKFFEKEWKNGKFGKKLYEDYKDSAF